MYSPTVVHGSLVVNFDVGATRRSSLACLVFIAAVANVDRAPRRYVMCLRGVFHLRYCLNGSHSGVCIDFISEITRN